MDGGPPGLGHPGLQGPYGGGGGGGALDFVDDLRTDISSYLLQKGTERDILDRMGGVLVYMRPSGSEKERWRAVRGTLQRSSKPVDGCGPRALPPQVFGAPAHSSVVHWPPRPAVDPRTEKPKEPKKPTNSDDSGSDLEKKFEGSDAEHSSDEASNERKQKNGASASNAPASGNEQSSGSEGNTNGVSWLTPGPAEAAAGKRNAEEAAAGKSDSKAETNFNGLLQFTSCFESGNLRYAVHQPRIPDGDADGVLDGELYELVLDNDINTYGHTQWFYFAVKGGVRGQSVHMTIINMSKATSLFCKGMRPVVWSEVTAAEEFDAVAEEHQDSLVNGDFISHIWTRGQEKIDKVNYRRSRIARVGSSSYHSLKFRYTFEHDGDCVYFAYTTPYTYSMLRTSLSAIKQQPCMACWCRRRRLCHSLGGIDCDLIGISNWAISKRLKKTVVVSARVHPGESNASWLVHGLISFLLSFTAEAEVLRDHFIWQVVPMLNPDGVICGNYRCGLAGVDLNRQWRHPQNSLHRTVYEMKRLITKLKKRSDLCLYIDLHGHSRKYGLFSYACANYQVDDSRRYWVRMYPKLLSMLSPEFVFSSCRWRAGPGKRGTGRVVVAKDIGLATSYTIEASFFGAPLGDWDPNADDKDEDEEGDSEGDDEEKKKNSDDERSPRLTKATKEKDGKKEPKEAKEPGPRKDIVLFTPAKLQEMGANLARVLILQHRLGKHVQNAMRARAQAAAMPMQKQAYVPQEPTSPTETSSKPGSADPPDVRPRSRRPANESLNHEDGTVTDPEVGNACEASSSEVGSSASVPSDGESDESLFEAETDSGASDHEGDGPQAPEPQPAPPDVPAEVAASPSPPPCPPPVVTADPQVPRQLKNGSTSDTATPQRQKHIWRKPDVPQCVAPPLGVSVKLSPAADQIVDMSDDCEDLPYLGIDLKDVLGQLQKVPESDFEGDSVGSESDPSADNAAENDLRQIGRLLLSERKQRQAQEQRRRRRRANSPRAVKNRSLSQGHAATSRLSRDHSHRDLSRRAKENLSLRARSTDSLGKATSGTLQRCGSNTEPPTPDLRRLVAFGRTTYVPQSKLPSDSDGAAVVGAERRLRTVRSSAEVRSAAAASASDDGGSESVTAVRPAAVAAGWPPLSTSPSGSLSTGVSVVGATLASGVTSDSTVQTRPRGISDNCLLNGPRERFAYLQRNQVDDAAQASPATSSGARNSVRQNPSDSAGPKAMVGRPLGGRLRMRHAGSAVMLRPSMSEPPAGAGRLQLVPVNVPANICSKAALIQGVAVASSSGSIHEGAVREEDTLPLQREDDPALLTSTAPSSGSISPNNYSQRRSNELNEHRRPYDEREGQLPQVGDVLQREVLHRERLFEVLMHGPKAGGNAPLDSRRRDVECTPSSGRSAIIRGTSPSLFQTSVPCSPSEGSSRRIEKSITDVSPRLMSSSRPASEGLMSSPKGMGALPLFFSNSTLQEAATLALPQSSANHVGLPGRALSTGTLPQSSMPEPREQPCSWLRGEHRDDHREDEGPRSQQALGISVSRPVLSASPYRASPSSETIRPFGTNFGGRIASAGRRRSGLTGYSASGTPGKLSLGRPASETALLSADHRAPREVHQGSWGSMLSRQRDQPKRIAHDRAPIPKSSSIKNRGSKRSSASAKGVAHTDSRGHNSSAVERPSSPPSSANFPDQGGG